MKQGNPPDRTARVDGPLLRWGRPVTPVEVEDAG